MENKKLKLDQLNRVDLNTFKTQEKQDIVLILDNIRSLNNVGTFFRTGDAFNVKKIYLCGITGTPPHRDIHKTALGSTDSVEWSYFDEAISLVQTLKSQQTKVFAVEQTAQAIQLQHAKRVFNEPIALIFGNEVDGVQQNLIDLADDVLEIPQFGTKHSLNVSVSLGIVLWEFTRRNLT
jgi:tRNA G18 (ribose-2'-O)-methylase SpoU